MGLRFNVGDQIRINIVRYKDCTGVKITGILPSRDYFDYNTSLGLCFKDDELLPVVEEGAILWD